MVEYSLCTAETWVRFLQVAPLGEVMQKPKWLDRNLMNGPHLCLCLNEKQFKSQCKKLEVDIQWRKSDASTYSFSNDSGKLITIVGLNQRKGIDKLQIYALLVHEAVHVFQEYCSSIGETNPSPEFEAYSIQWISQQLFYEYDRLNRR